MSMRQLVSRSVVTAFVLGFPSLAFARQPPALVRAQAATDYAVACGGARVEAGSGYRDALARLGGESKASTTTVAKNDRGYRGAFSSAASTEAQIACGATPRLSASR